MAVKTIFAVLSKLRGPLERKVKKKTGIVGEWEEYGDRNPNF